MPSCPRVGVDAAWPLRAGWGWGTGNAVAWEGDEKTSQPCDRRVNRVLLRRNVTRFRGAFVCKAHSLVCHSTLGPRVIKKKQKKKRVPRGLVGGLARLHTPHTLHPILGTRNTMPGTRNPKTEIRDPKPELLSLEQPGCHISVPASLREGTARPCRRPGAAASAARPAFGLSSSKPKPPNPFDTSSLYHPQMFNYTPPQMFTSHLTPFTMRRKPFTLEEGTARLCRRPGAAAYTTHPVLYTLKPPGCHISVPSSIMGETLRWFGTQNVCVCGEIHVCCVGCYLRQR